MQTITPEVSKQRAGVPLYQHHADILSRDATALGGVQGCSALLDQCGRRFRVNLTVHQPLANDRNLRI
jgi:hypothetical protein